MFLNFEISKAALTVGLLTVTAGFLWTQWSKARKIAALGGVAPQAGSSLFLGLDFPLQSVRALAKDEAPDFWLRTFESSGALKNNNYTCEISLLATTRLIMTADVANIKAILASQFQEFGKGQKFHANMVDFLGDGIFTTDGQLWSDSRSLIRPMFMREKVADLDLLEPHVRKLIELLGPGDGGMVRFDELVFAFSLDTSTHFLFGQSVNSLENPQVEFATAWDELERFQVMLDKLGPLRYFYPQSVKRKALKVVNDFIEPIITSVLALPKADLDTTLDQRDTFIHALARFTRDRKVIRDQIISLLLAGRDTTSSTLSWLFLELSRHPHVVKKLRSEIIKTIGGSGRPPTYQEIKNMKYLTWVINETLRLYPAVPFNVRTSLKETSLPHGAGPTGEDPVGVTKDTDIMYSPLLMHRREDLYPPLSESFPYHPHEWAPDRWATWTPKAWHFIPFNGGPRICLGQNFAMIEMGYTITRLLQEYDEIIDFGNTSKMHIEIVTTPADGTKVGFKKSSSKRGSYST